MKSKLKNPNTLISLVLQASLILLSLSYPLLSPQKANATVTTFYVRLDRQSATAPLSGVVCEQTSTTGTEAFVEVVFPNTFTINQTPGNWATDTTAANLPAGATAWPSIGATASNVTGLSVRFASGDLTSSSNTYCFHFVGTSSNVGSAGNDLNGIFYTKNNVLALIDQMNWATSITSGANSEQITITASVSASFSFSLSANSISLGTINSSTVSTGSAAVTATVSTNGHNGFISWVKGTNADGLHSTTTGTGISSPFVFGSTFDLGLPAVNGYGVYGTAGTNSPTIDTGYNPPNGNNAGHVDSTQFDRIAFLTGAQSGTTFTINARAKASSTQAAGTDYSDILTVVASGSF